MKSRPAEIKSVHVPEKVSEPAAYTDPINRLVPALTLWGAVCGLFLGILSLIQNSLEAYPAPILIMMAIFLLLLFLDVYRQHKTWDLKLLGLGLLAILLMFILHALPEYITGLQINAIVHHSIFSAIFLSLIAIPAMSVGIFYLLGATPSAEDASRYPILLFPVIVIVGLYLLLIAQLVTSGISNFSWQILTQPFLYHSVPKLSFIGGDWPWWGSILLQQPGMLYHLEGTGMLMLLTTIISLPIGMGAGVYLSEYGRGYLANFTRFAIHSLRAISLLVLGLTAFSLASMSTNSLLAPALHGFFFNGFVNQVGTGGSFLAASIALSFLVIPVITRSTEEGCQSLPVELREGSIALGASEETTLLRVVLPWSLPNIVTAVLLGCAEAAGSVAVIMFIAARGDYGVSPFTQVTSLAYLIFDSNYGDKAFTAMMGSYQFMAGMLLLVITLGLGILAMLLKAWLVRRHRGG